MISLYLPSVSAWMLPAGGGVSLNAVIINSRVSTSKYNQTQSVLLPWQGRIIIVSRDIKSYKDNIDMSDDGQYLGVW